MQKIGQVPMIQCIMLSATPLAVTDVVPKVRSKPLVYNLSLIHI